jgi:endonuclease YncB( thermonuclease family)
MRALLISLILGLASPVAATEFSGGLRVIDGDTVDVGPVRVRLFGIDAPERDQTCKTEQGADWDCGIWASLQVAGRFDGHTAQCSERDIDRYGRIVAACVVDGQDMGRMIVAEGWAFAYRRYSMAYDLDEKAAFVARRGLHGSQVQSPAEFRRTERQVAPFSGTCQIKGNISAKGARIYHSPGQRDYDATRISPAKGERMFCSAAEAEAAGWRAARR